MRQAAFEAALRPRVGAFEQWLDRTSGSAGARPTQALEPAHALADADVPERYRRVCQHLALAARPPVQPRARRPPESARAARPPPALWRDAAARRRAGARVRAGAASRAWCARSGRFVIAAAALFFGPFLAHDRGAAVLSRTSSYYLLAPRADRAVPRDVRPGEPAPRACARPTTNFAMFGFYIWNNVRIGFQTFAGGLARSASARVLPAAQRRR